MFMDNKEEEISNDLDNNVINDYNNHTEEFADHEACDSDKLA